MFKQKLNIAFFLVIFIITLSGCTPDQNEHTDDVYIVYTTVFPIQDFTEKIGGDYVKVKTVYPPGTDEHTFEPTQKDIIDMANSNLFLYIGYGLEGFVEKTRSVLEKEGVKILAIGEEVHLEDLNGTDDHDHHDDGHNHGNVDPHLWVDPILAKELAENIKEVLIEEMPEHKSYFESNYEKLIPQFDKIHEDFQTIATSSKHQKFIVSHAAYSYWESRYDLQQLSISGLSTTDEPSQKELVQIIDEVKQYNLNYILVEQNVSNRLTDIIKNEAQLEVLPIHNLSVLTEEDIKNEEDYFSLMKKNYESLKTALNN